MPYIKQEDRKNLMVFGKSEFTVGELNYIITQLLLSQNPKCYEDFNALIGVLECCKLELYRRKIVPYEIEKCSENGDVY